MALQSLFIIPTVSLLSEIGMLWYLQLYEWAHVNVHINGVLYKITSYSDYPWGLSSLSIWMRRNHTNTYYSHFYVNGDVILFLLHTPQKGDKMNTAERPGFLVTHQGLRPFYTFCLSFSGQEPVTHYQVSSDSSREQ